MSSNWESSRSEIVGKLKELKQRRAVTLRPRPYELPFPCFRAGILYKGDDLTVQFFPLLDTSTMHPAPSWWVDPFPQLASDLALEIYYPRTYPSLSLERIHLPPRYPDPRQDEPVLDSWYFLVKDEAVAHREPEERLIRFLGELDQKVASKVQSTPPTFYAAGPAPEHPQPSPTPPRARARTFSARRSPAR
jgi:hypothetical protein